MGRFRTLLGVRVWERVAAQPATCFSDSRGRAQVRQVPTPTKRTCSAISKWTSRGVWDIHTTCTPAVQFQNIFLTPQLGGFGVTVLLFEEIGPARLLRADGSVAALGSMEAACLAGRGFCPSSSQGRGVVRAGTGGGGLQGPP